jgi:hypothetical protein
VRPDLNRLSTIALVLALLPATFLVVNFLHFEHLPVRVLLYACVLDAIAATAITGLIVFVLLRRSMDRTDATLSFALANALVLIYAIMGPTVVDRSLSLYIVEKVDQHGGEVAAAAMDDIFIEEYLPEFRVVEVRITEQLQSGTLVMDGDCLRLTERGEAVAGFVRWYRRMLLPRRRVLLEEETDALRRPFDNSPPPIEVACRAS